MRVYLIAAPEDQAEAEKLAEYLKRFGVFIRTEFGQMAYPPAQFGEFTVVLWSRNAMISSRQMMLTNRAMDAWEEGRLVMVRLEHGLNPRGLADLNMVDLTFPSAREHRYHDVLNELRSAQDNERRPRFDRRSSMPASPTLHMPSPAPGRPAKNPPTERADEGNISDRSEVTRAEATQSATQDRSGRTLGVGAPQQPIKTAREPVKTGRSLMIPILLASGLWAVLVTGATVWLISSNAEINSLEIGITLMSTVLLIGAGAYFASLLFGGSADTDPVETVRPKPSTPDQNTSDSPHTFFSYSSANGFDVLQLVDQLETQGEPVWIDRDGIRAGEGWAGAIVRAIKSSGRFCLMCSAQSFSSHHVHREIYLADKYQKEIIPVRLDRTEAPEDIELFLIDRQWVDLTSINPKDRASIVRKALRRR
ncbi:MAG: toll/interleukin-1 receptor domain-containing protein [Pseudomonadota bacterium]